MKAYNKPFTQISDCQTRYMLMSGNVSATGISGVNETTGGQNIEIN
ncbi:MAG: hypothetical protein IK073_00220 [Paludibacteraceae bacterium]|nr:hypothetical protein [Paludibacteraceae bacterium]